MLFVQFFYPKEDKTEIGREGRSFSAALKEFASALCLKKEEKKVVNLGIAQKTRRIIDISINL
ncbi:MAG: hypothetical protein HFF40_06565 [Lawsonibacter sp.]|jgi:hypothetical protein|nr:hypothetical protein [Lawsonibacter sp.]